jgi:hypothetical protein
MTESDVDHYAHIDELLKQYGVEVFKGNFYKMKQLKDQLLELGV